MKSAAVGKRSRKQTSKQNAYIGKAGQLAVMAEFALRGYNVSLPEIDKGDDIFVVNDHTRQLWRIQVKASTPQSSRQGNYQVVVLDKQITTVPAEPEDDLHFVFALRHDQGCCWDFLVVPRSDLRGSIEKRRANGQKFGSLKKDGRRTLSISRPKKAPNEIHCSRLPWTGYKNNWDNWPQIWHDELPNVPATGDLIAG